MQFKFEIIWTRIIKLWNDINFSETFLIEFRAFAVIRKWFFKVNSLTDLFENVKIDDVLSFLRETELYQKIWQIKTG